MGEDREQQIEETQAMIEHSLELIGATAIEDKLQEQVPECIAALRSASIKIWVLTGDKMETAINIGFAANLLARDMELWKLDGRDGEEGDTEVHGQRRVPLDLKEADILTKISHRVGKAVNNFKLERTGPAARPSLLDLGDSLSVLNEPIQSADVDTNKIIRKNIKNAKKARKKNLRLNSESFMESPTAPSFFRSPSVPLAAISDSHHKPTRYSRSLFAENTSIKDPPSQFPNALALDGSALDVILKDQYAAEELVQLAPIFRSVICCRASPLQKSQVVSLIRKGLSTLTLAIGDGANDVSMIQAANVGVGISGVEGMQAANSSDYKIARFHYLQNLLLVHGLFNYLRFSEAVMYFFYKNIIWALAPFWYGSSCLFSGNLLFSFIYIQTYNLVFTLFPVFFLGTIDKPFNYKTAMLYTGTYRLGIRNAYFSYRRFAMYALDGFYQAAAIFLVFFLFTLSYPVLSSGKMWSIANFSTGIVVTIIICTLITAFIDSYQSNYFMIFVAIFSVASYFAIGPLGAALNLDPTLEQPFSFYQEVYASPVFWLSVFMATLLAVLPRFLFTYYSRALRPKDIDVVREIKILKRPWYGQVST
ncbi:Phospholipid-transporting ATPase DNF1 [Zancudomyces culisetae]|uniref:Phospholipid-transporting ATPase DNF1 n=1 Tax=Zancudomyces culisetae TaxID=1213189 RepID=A0A1R1PLX3_ZANCU|nr:Phospholipid-transporting ATPase DNF1 [Zancudomyces culisetae]|eukprot:OMH81964.1 Phospholipid-transporting ATPase DNF1 [Zancudomyces culisetae]